LIAVEFSPQITKPCKTHTAAINPADEKASYLASAELEALKQYFQSGSLRVKASSQIGASASSIISETWPKPVYGNITPGGNMYPTRRYAACLRALTYFLRYATYAMLRHMPQS